MSRCFINARSLVSTARRAILLELATTHIGVHTRAKVRDIQNGEMRACVRKSEGRAGNERRQRTCAPLFSIGNRRQPRAPLSNCDYARLQPRLYTVSLRLHEVPSIQRKLNSTPLKSTTRMTRDDAINQTPLGAMPLAWRSTQQSKTIRFTINRVRTQLGQMTYAACDPHIVNTAGYFPA